MPSFHQIRLSAGRNAVVHSAQRTELAVSQLSRLPLNLPNINPADYHVWCAMLEVYHKLKTKPKTIAELDETLQVIWGNLPQGSINKIVKDFLS